MCYRRVPLDSVRVYKHPVVIYLRLVRSNFSNANLMEWVYCMAYLVQGDGPDFSIVPEAKCM